MLNATDDLGAAGLLALEVLVSSGEPLALPLLQQLDALLPEHTAILNLYGSAEVGLHNSSSVAMHCPFTWAGRSH